MTSRYGAARQPLPIHEIPAKLKSCREPSLEASRKPSGRPLVWLLARDLDPVSGLLPIGIAVYRRGEIGQVARALRVLDALRGFKLGRWVTEVAKEIGASERTVRRDITELQDAGFDIEVTKRDNRVISCLASERNYSPVSITKRERFTLLAVRNVFDVLRGTPFHDDVHSVMAKLEQRMNDKERDEIATFGERFVYLPDHGTKSYAGKDDIIDAIQTGILSRKVVRYRYADARGRSRNGFLAPYGMVLYRHGLYTVGGRLKAVDSDAGSASIGVFAIERFAEAEHLRAHDFEMPADFHIRNALHGAFGPHLVDEAGPREVIVEFSREKAMLVSSRTWHETQRIDELADGRIRLTFQTPHLAPVVSWILEWGPHALAIAPLELVQQVRRELDEARAQY
ncbi:MAG: helix-turn-helix transcriptional regulator [Kofleriaceae bacterium]